MIWVTAEDVVAIHSRIIQVSGGIVRYWINDHIE